LSTKSAFGKGRQHWNNSSFYSPLGIAVQYRALIADNLRKFFVFWLENQVSGAGKSGQCLPALDEGGHSEKTSMTKNTKPNTREARLAEALRANLKRRRAQVKRRAQAGGEPENAADPAVNPPQTPLKQQD
jgi:hypothetical protein